ncbi:hypothetical protein AZ19_1740 [Bordetella bronchiseptica E012]|uniref:hypothetical protein n=1 Tax=Bordetella bronchiseptica TaxID=518 RepID=UPI000461006C|nr:hypothetical protein [Bordetella bronchiseptica]AZW22948.1 hypothetical protein CS345_17335 [Bordetella bronchiseptica]KDC12332.1 hypothetical protein AZ19_1740 [Bordetella bronchiseptica E012]
MNPYLILWSLALVALVAGDEFFYRRFLRDRDARVAVFTVAAVLTALVFGYGEVQQRDESTLTACEGCGKTAVAAKE